MPDRVRIDRPETRPSGPGRHLSGPPQVGPFFLCGGAGDRRNPPMELCPCIPPPNDSSSSPARPARSDAPSSPACSPSRRSRTGACARCATSARCRRIRVSSRCAAPSRTATAVQQALQGVTHVLHLATSKETPEDVMDVVGQGPVLAARRLPHEPELPPVHPDRRRCGDRPLPLPASGAGRRDASRTAPTRAATRSRRCSRRPCCSSTSSSTG